MDHPVIVFFLFCFNWRDIYRIPKLKYKQNDTEFHAENSEQMNQKKPQEREFTRFNNIFLKVH